MSTNTYNDTVSVDDFKTMTDFTKIVPAIKQRYELYWFSAIEKLIDGQKTTKFNFPLNTLVWKLTEQFAFYFYGKRPTRKDMDGLFGVEGMAKIFNNKWAFTKDGLDNGKDEPFYIEGEDVVENPIALYWKLKKIMTDWFLALEKVEEVQKLFLKARAKIYK